MKHFAFGILFLVSLITTAQENRPEASTILESLVNENMAVGGAIGYSIGDSILWNSARGYSDKKAQRPFETHTKLRMASIAKSMTALAAMQLVEKGKLDIDVPIQNYIPDYPKHSGTQITTRHLLSHTSGISGYKNTKESNTQTEYASLYEAIDIFKDRELVFEPGTKYSYTTYGYTVLGVIIEKVSGQTFEKYMQHNIWDKAGMKNTGVDKFGIQVEHESRLYHRKKGKGKAKEGPENNLSNRIPGGGLYTTIEDILKFGKAVLNDVFVSKETLDLMRQHHSLEKERNAYGFGWFLYNPKPNEGAVIGHSGGQMGCSSFLLIVPEKKVVAAVLTNTSRVEVGQQAFQLLNLALEKVEDTE
ncbi:serine hydrolase domain-containing protein [Maribacter sp. 2308TA10-17]|uniref:serine hydrolase domain-containing protein n=1 Tax=Maribacter sp. 2308TA10-17 TaxID=3386276 RepID=UPI0039BCF9F5